MRIYSVRRPPSLSDGVVHEDFWPENIVGDSGGQLKMVSKQVALRVKVRGGVLMIKCRDSGASPEKFLSQPNPNQNQ